MDILWRLVFGHLVADFTLQTDFIAAWKRRSWAGLFVHVTTHPVLYVLLTWPFLREEWVSWGPVSLNGWACLVVIYVTHFIEDKWRVWAVTTNREPDNLFFYAWDQVFHLLIIFLVAPVSRPIAMSRWPMLGCLAVVVTHFATVSVYFVEKDLYGRQFPAAREKYGAMAQRALLFFCFFLPGRWIWLALAAVGVQPFVARRLPAFAVSRIGFWAGNGLTVASGLLARSLYI